MSLSSKGRYRQIHDRVWVDEWFRGLDDDPRMLWFYLLTCEHWHGSLPGLFRCRPETMAADIGWSVERLRKTLDLIVSAGRVKVDPPTGLVWVVHSHCYLCPQEKTKTMVENWPRMVQSLPECPLREEAWSAICLSVSERTSKRSSDRSGSRFPDPGSLIQDPGSDLDAPRTVPKQSADTSGTVPEQPRRPLSMVHPAADPRPFLPDILEAQRAAWRLEIPPQPPTGDDMERLVQAYHLGEAHAPGDGVVWACLAVKGHRARVARDDLDGLAAERRMAWPPVQESGPDGRPRAKWRELDGARYSELVEEGRWVGRKRPETWADGRPRMPGV